MIKRFLRKRKIEKKVKEFRIELKRSLETAIIAAFGFLIALVWRDVITEYVNTITAISPVKGKVITAFIVTIISVIGILFATRFLSEK